MNKKLFRIASELLANGNCFFGRHFVSSKGLMLLTNRRESNKGFVACLK